MEGEGRRKVESARLGEKTSGGIIGREGKRGQKEERRGEERCTDKEYREGDKKQGKRYIIRGVQREEGKVGEQGRFVGRNNGRERARRVRRRETTDA